MWGYKDTSKLVRMLPKGVDFQWWNVTKFTALKYLLLLVFLILKYVFLPENYFWNLTQLISDTFRLLLKYYLYGCLSLLPKLHYSKLLLKNVFWVLFYYTLCLTTQTHVGCEWWWWLNITRATSLNISFTITHLLTTVTHSKYLLF